MAEEKNTIVSNGELVANCDQFSSLKHSTVCSFAFTEQGVAMLASVLRSETAIRVSIRIMDAFVSMRHFLINNADVFRRLSTIEYHQLEMMHHQQESDKRIDEVFRRLDEGTVQPKQGIFYDGQVYDAYAFVSYLVKSAKRHIVLIDNYVEKQQPRATPLVIIDDTITPCKGKCVDNKIVSVLLLPLQVGCSKSTSKTCSKMSQKANVTYCLSKR